MGVYRTVGMLFRKMLARTEIINETKAIAVDQDKRCPPCANADDESEKEGHKYEGEG